MAGMSLQVPTVLSRLAASARVRKREERGHARLLSGDETARAQAAPLRARASTCALSALAHARWARDARTRSDSRSPVSHPRACASHTWHARERARARSTVHAHAARAERSLHTRPAQQSHWRARS
eukprot:6192805-Pleurochrysis_carterae.AAC.3